MKTLPSLTSRLTRARIEPLDETGFEFADHGFVAEILAVPGWSGDLIELIAWKPEQPNRWWLNKGTLPILGKDLADFTTDVRKRPVVLVETPAAWHRAAAAGRDDVICVVDWSADPRFLLTGLSLVGARALKNRVQAWWAEHTRPNFTFAEARDAA